MIRSIKILLALFSFYMYGQQNLDISLPETNDKLRVTLSDYKVHKIYVTNNEEIYFEKERLRFWDQITTKINESERIPNFKAVNDIIFYADKNVAYYTIEKLISEIGRSWTGYIHIKCGSENNSNGLTKLITGSFYRSEKYRLKVDWTFNLPIIYTKKEKEGETKPPKLKESSWPLPPNILTSDFSSSFYSMDSLETNKLLASFKYKTLNLGYDGFYYKKDDKEKYVNTEELKEIVHNHDLLFLLTTSITLQDYVDNIAKIYEYSLQKNNGKQNHLINPFILEIPSFFLPELSKFFPQITGNQSSF